MSITIDSGNPAFDKALGRMAKIHKAKNHDYSKPENQDYYANFHECEDLGLAAWKGILVRMCDKWSRIKRLSTKEAAVKDESIEDTLIDLANYSLLCMLVRAEDKATSEKPNAR